MKIKQFLSLVLVAGASMSVYGQSQSFSGGFNLSVMACQDGSVYHAGRIAGTDYPTFTQVLKGEQVNPTSFLQDIVQVNGGSGSHILALDCDGFVYSWGGNGQGQLGNGVAGGQSATPVRVLAGTQTPNVSGFLENVTWVAGGDLSSYALLTDGRVMSWGNNQNGRLGDGTTTQRTTPVYVRIDAATFLDNVIQVYGGEEFAVALRADGTVWSWGSNLHDGNNGAQSAYAKQVRFADSSPLTNIIRISGGDTHTLALDSDGVLWSWGGNWESQLGDGLCCNDPYPKPVIGINETAPTTNILRNVVNFSAGAFMSVAVLSDGRAVGWGTNRDNSNGTGVNTNVPQYIRTPDGTAPIENIVDVATGDRHGFAQDGDGQLYTWGWNPNGQLALNHTTNQNFPQPVNMPCGILTPCPEARLGPDVVLCNPVAVELYAGAIAPYFGYVWYKDGDSLTNYDDNYATGPHLFVNEPGTYRVVITDTSATSTCDPCPPSEDEIVISTASVAPINAEFCIPPDKEVTLRVDDPDNTFDWYTEPAGGTLVASGTNTYTTPPISETTTYYVEDTRVYSYTTGYAAEGGDGLGSLNSAYNNSASGYMEFTVEKTITLVSVRVRGAGGCTGSPDRTINLVPSGGGVPLQSATEPMACASGAITTFPLGFTITPGNYRLSFTPSHSVQYYDDGALYPFGIPSLISLTGTGKWNNSASSFFFDWEIEAPSSCERIPVQAILTTNCPAPVEFLSFTGNRVGTDNHLFWSTVSEENSDFFEVQRSVDGETFTPIGYVDAAGHSSGILHYTFADTDVPGETTVVYYRLRQVDFDGTFMFSTVVAIHHADALFSWSIYPNPVPSGGNLYVRMHSLQSVSARIHLYDLHGKQVVQQVQAVQEGNGHYTVATGHLPSGMYVIKLYTGNDAPRIRKVVIE